MSRRVDLVISNEQYEKLQQLMEHFESEYGKKVTIKTTIIECINAKHEEIRGLVWLGGYIDKDVYDKAKSKAKKNNLSFTLNNILKKFRKSF